MNVLEYVIILKIFGGLASELLDVGACAEGFRNFAEEENDFDIR